MVEASSNRVVAFALIAAALGVSCGPGPVHPDDPEVAPDAWQGGPSGPPGYRLVFEEEFEGSKLDESVWTAMRAPMATGWLVPEACTVEGGTLTIKTFTENGVHSSGHVDTAGKFQPQYGYFEARIRFNNSPGQWGAFWLYTPTYGNPVGDPGTAGVEVDIVEHRAEDDQGRDLGDIAAMVLHWDGAAAHKREVRFMRPDGPSLQGNWHTYAVLWTESGYTFYIDAVPLWSTDAAVSHRDQFVVLSAPLGKWAGDAPSGGFGSRETTTTSMEVDWVRVWQKDR